jgi:hypothetical protein
MSYILSALRKAEEERRRGETHVGERMLAHEPVPANRHAGLKLGVAVALLAMTAGLGYWFTAEDRSHPSTAMGPLPSAALPPSYPSPAKIAIPATSEPVSETQPLPDEGSALETPAPATTRPATGEVAKIPPTLNITGYIYFESNPEKSKLFVDGIVYRLNSQVVRGLTIDAFHEDHIDVLYHGAPATISIP